MSDMSQQTPVDVVMVVPSFNQRELLAECLRSLALALAQAGLSGRVVVVDNASWDGSAELVKSQFPDVTLIENELNAGFAVACNQGGRAFASRYVLLVNNDATLQPGSLEAAVAHADGDPRIGALTGRLLAPSGRERYPARHFWERAFPPRPRIHALTWVPGTCVLLRREALDAVGWLDEDFFFYNEDLDLSWRLRKAGWKLIYHPAFVVRHHESASSRLIRPRAMLEAYRGSLLLARKHHGALGYHLTRLALRADVGLRLFYWRLRGALGDADGQASARREAYEAIKQVLRQGVVPAAPAGVATASELD